MAIRFVLDTHALVWYVEGSTRLSSAAKAIMDDPASEMILPAMRKSKASYLRTPASHALSPYVGYWNEY